MIPALLENYKKNGKNIFTKENFFNILHSFYFIHNFIQLITFSNKYNIL
jgi:hypothetical protein